MQRDAKDVFSNFEDEKFSYLVIRRGEKPDKLKVNLDQASPSELSDASFYWDRAVRRALRKKKHVIIDLCSRRGAIERHVIPKSYGRSVYGDAKELFWGDLWPHPSRKEENFLSSLEDGSERDDAGEEAEDDKEVLEEKRPVKKAVAAGRGSKERRSAREIEEEFERELLELEGGELEEPSSQSEAETLPEKELGRARGRGRGGRKGREGARKDVDGEAS